MTSRTKKPTYIPCDLEPTHHENGFIEHSINIGVRIKLTPDQKKAIKDRYDELMAGEVPAAETRSTTGLTITTAQTPVKLIQDCGLDRTTLGVVLASHERLPITQLLRWERALNLRFLDRKMLVGAFNSYLDHLEIK